MINTGYGVYILTSVMTQEITIWILTSGLYAKWQIEGGHAGGYKSGNFGNTTLELRTYHKGLFKNNNFCLQKL